MAPNLIAPTPTPVPEPRAKLKSLVKWLAVPSLVAIALVIWWRPWAASPTLVVIETAVLAPVTRVLAVNGRMAGVVSIDLRPSVAGVLTDVAVIEGQVVTKGEVMARIDAATAEAALRQALASLDAALVAEAEIQASYARTKAMGANVARVTLESSARAVTTAGQDVARLTALLDQAQILVAKYTLRAPLAGTVLALSATVGQTVAGSDVVMTIADLNRLLVETDVDESYAMQVKPGQRAVLQLSGETQLREAHVSFVSGQVDPATGGLAVKITPDVAILAPIGLTVTANITVEDNPSALTIPRAALTEDAVWLESGGKVLRRPVQVIPWPASRLIVTGGLMPGDRVITDPTGLTEGQTVAVAP